jgi:hypothetical protein
VGTRKQYEGLWLHPDDLDLLRRVRARSIVAESGNPAMTVEEAQQAQVDEAVTLASLRQKYDIPPEEAVAFSMLDGMVMETDEEV